MIPHLLTLMTTTPAAPATNIPGDWVLALVGLIITTLLGGLVGKKIGKTEAQGMRLEEPVPTVPTRKVPGLVTWDHLQPLIQRMDRLERHIDDVRKEQSDQFKELLEAGAAREQRLVDKVDEMARAIHARIDDHLPRTRRQG